MEGTKGEVSPKQRSSIRPVQLMSICISTLSLLLTMVDHWMVGYILNYWSEKWNEAFPEPNIKFAKIKLLFQKFKKILLPGKAENFHRCLPSKVLGHEHVRRGCLANGMIQGMEELPGDLWDALKAQLNATASMALSSIFNDFDGSLVLPPPQMIAIITVSSGRNSACNIYCFTSSSVVNLSLPLAP